MDGHGIEFGTGRALPDDKAAYAQWLAAFNTPNGAMGTVALSSRRVSLILPVGDSTAEAALDTAASVRRQSSAGWELLVATRGLYSPWAREAYAQLCRDDERLRAVQAAPGCGLVQSALTTATGELVCVVTPGDLLARDAVAEMVDFFASNAATRLAYSDEDRWDDGARCAPAFKPGYSPDLVLAGNYFGQLTVYETGLLKQAISGSPAEPFSAFRTTLRAVSGLPANAVGHLPRVLYHRRGALPDWPSAAPGGLCVADPIKIGSVEAGWPHPRFPLPGALPLVSILICTRDKPDLLRRCAHGLLQATDYPALELVIVDHESTDPGAVALLGELRADPRVRVLRYAGDFNFAAMNNAAARSARGSVLLLLNNDTEILHADWLREMVAHAVRPDVGAVGAKLLYPNGTVQHAGVLLGPGGSATHVGRHEGAETSGYLGQLVTTRDLTAVTGACLATRRSVFDEVGGLNERLAVTWNDIDYCLRVRAAGLRTIFTPFARLVHHEAVTRGREADCEEKHRRFLREQELMREIWGEALERDPFLNPNLLATEDGKLALAAPRGAALGPHLAARPEALLPAS